MTARKIHNEVKLDFSDVLILPRASDVLSRNDVDLTREITFKRSDDSIKKIWRGIPIVASNMDSVGTFEMYYALVKYQMMTCFHKHYDVDDYPLDLNPDYYSISVGTSQQDYEKLQQLIQKLNPTFVTIDVANGYCASFFDFVKKVSKNYPDIVLICGNVVTDNECRELIQSGADIVKIGLGSGACCLTRKLTGVGYPQLSAILDTKKVLNKFKMSDGGCVTPSDIAKALCAGSDFVMIGSMLAGHSESGGCEIEGYKICYGMSSRVSMEKYNNIKDYRSSEGKCVKILHRGSVEKTIENILGGLRSCCTYIGARKIEEMERNSTFIRVNHQLNNSLNQYEI